MGKETNTAHGNGDKGKPGPATGKSERGWMNPVGPDPVLYPDPSPDPAVPPEPASGTPGTGSGTVEIGSGTVEIGSGTSQIGSGTGQIGSGTPVLPAKE